MSINDILIDENNKRERERERERERVQTCHVLLAALHHSE